MSQGQFITCEKIETQFVKNGAAGGSFLNALANKLSKSICQDITLLARDKTL